MSEAQTNAEIAMGVGKHRQLQAVPVPQWKVRSGCAAVVLGLGTIAVTMFGGAASAAVSDASGVVAPTCVTTTAPESTTVTEPETTQPETTVTTQPETTQPETTVTTQPETTQPETTVTTQPETTQPETTDTTEPEGTFGLTTGPDFGQLAVGERIDVSGVTTLTVTSLPSLPSLPSLTSLPSGATCDSTSAASEIVTPPADGSSAVAASSSARAGEPVVAGSAGVAAESDSRSAAAADTSDLATTGGPGTYVLLAGLCLLAAGVMILISTAPNRIGRRSH